MVYPALAAAEELAAEGVSVEVIDPRTLVPLDVETIRESVRKTGPPDRGRRVARQPARWPPRSRRRVAEDWETCRALRAPVRRVLHGGGAGSVQPAAGGLRAAGPGPHRRRRSARCLGTRGDRMSLSSRSARFALSANHVGIGVSDLSRSIAFYRDLLGFNVAYERGEVTAEYMPRLVGIPGARLKIAGLDIPGPAPGPDRVHRAEGRCHGRPASMTSATSTSGFTVDDMWAAYNALVGGRACASSPSRSARPSARTRAAGRSTSSTRTASRWR